MTETFQQWRAEALEAGATWARDSETARRIYDSIATKTAEHAPPRDEVAALRAENLELRGRLERLERLLRHNGKMIPITALISAIPGVLSSLRKDLEAQLGANAQQFDQRSASIDRLEQKLDALLAHLPGAEQAAHRLNQ
jgi:septation ring formation regulator EzrA